MIMSENEEVITTEEIVLDLLNPNQIRINNIMKALTLSEIHWMDTKNDYGEEQLKPVTAMTITGKQRKELVDMLVELIKG